MSAPVHQYPATAFHADSDSSVWMGVVCVEPQALVFTAEEVQVSIPLDRLAMARESSGSISFTDEDQPEWTVQVASDAILQNYFFQTRNRLRLQVREIRQTFDGMRNLRLALSFLAGVGIVVALVLGLTGWTIRFLVAFVPAGWEADLSRSAWEQIRTNITVIEPAEWPGSFHLSTNRLMASLPRSPYHYEFVLVSNREPNAIALPAGRILVHSGLFEFADQPEQIAGVLAHEMAHVTQRHGLQQLISSAGPYYVLRLFISDRRGFGALVRNGSLLLVRQNYSREHEREADALAWHHLVNARIDPQSLISFFEKLASNPLERLMDIKGLRLLRSHPPTTERIEDLRRLGRSQRPGIEFLPLTNAIPP